MAIVTYGSAATDEVESFLGLSAAIDTGTAVGEKQERLILGVEAWMQKFTRRTFTEAVYTNELHPASSHSRFDTFFLSDFPVSTFTSVVRIDTYNTDGTVDQTTTVDKDEYEVFSAEGMVQKRSGWWLDGLRRYRLTYTAGHPAADIASDATAEITLWKRVELELIAQAWQIARDGGGSYHMTGVSFGDESVSGLRFRPTPWAMDALEELKREIRF